MPVFVHTCPYQSWQNVAERVNLALMNVSLCRSLLDDEDSKKSVHAKKISYRAETFIFTKAKHQK